MKSFDYTISSTDSEHNNRIVTNLSNPQTEFCKMTITSLTTMANIVVLSKNDYFTINDTKYLITEDYSEVSASSLTEYLNTLIVNTDEQALQFLCDHCNRIYIASTYEFAFNDCSYNMRLLLGLTNVELPLQSRAVQSAQTTVYTLLFPDVGMFLSTPVLYLSSNLGSNSYKNLNQTTTSMRILMRINNSFFAKQPIIATNGDYTTVVRCSDLSDARFTLIDANYHEIKLLSPMYLTVQIEAIPDKPENEHDLSRGPVDPLSIIPMSEFAYMRDLTERGIDVDLNTVDQLIYVEPKQIDEEHQQNLSTVIPPEPSQNASTE